jgi:hypothetical protein
VSIFNSAKINDIFLLFIWCILLLLCTHTLQVYFLSGQPPFWDNLGYQTDALHILRDWLEGDWQNAIKSLYASRSPAHLLTLGFGYLVLGINTYSPYVISALFGFACLAAIYTLSVELGASRRAALWGVLIYSISSNFLYQNFLQTRNDFQLAFFITLSWILFIQAIKSESYKTIFFAGICAGLGTLFKASAPGYVIFGIFAFLMISEKYIHLPVKVRIKFIAFFVAGAVIVSGWHYLPHLKETFAYYDSWGKDAAAWKTSQYNLQSIWLDYLFYPRNIVHTHIGVLVSWFLSGMFMLLLIRRYIIRKPPSVSGRAIDDYALLKLTIGAAILPLAFISWKQSYSSLGDVPVLPLLMASGIVLIAKLCDGLTIHRYILIPMLLLGLGASLPTMPIVERQFIANDLDKFSSEISEFRQQYGLRNSQMLQIYGHPIYNVDTYSWLVLVNHNDKSVLPAMSPIDLTNVLFPEDANLIASKLLQYPMLIVSEFPGSVIDGAQFHTFNRLHKEINASLANEGQFIKLHTVILENGKFPIYIALNKNYSVFRPTSVTDDQWTEWRGEVEYFSLTPAKLIWRGIPTKPVKEFRLVDKGNPDSTITFRFVRDSYTGVPEYQSDLISGATNLRTFELLPEINHPIEAASAEDNRKLAFYNIETKVVKDEPQQ